MFSEITPYDYCHLLHVGVNIIIKIIPLSTTWNFLIQKAYFLVDFL